MLTAPDPRGCAEPEARGIARARDYLYGEPMPELPAPPAPSEQMELRRRLESVLGERGAPYHHNDRFWKSRNRVEMIYGWGTTVDRGDRAPIEVWFDGLDHDIVVTVGDRGRDWHECLDLTDLDSVLNEVCGAVFTLLDRSAQHAQDRRPRWRRPR